MKVLFDTNFYIVEGIGGAQPRRVLRACVMGNVRIFVSDFILAETRRVLVEDFGYQSKRAGILASRMQERAHVIKTPQSRHVVPDDENDTPILRAAIAASVDYLVTNDKHLLRKDPYEGVRILSINQFETLLRNQGLLG